jgi:hypothetical protein
MQTKVFKILGLLVSFNCSVIGLFAQTSGTGTYTNPFSTTNTTPSTGTTSPLTTGSTTLTTMDNNPGTTPGGPTTQDTSVPFDGGLSLLLTLGIAQGIRRSSFKKK